MNTKYLSILLLTLLIGFSSCENWLYTEPENGIIRDDFWQSKEDVHAAVMGIYASMLGNTTSGGYDFPTSILMWGEMRADYLQQNGTRSPRDYVDIVNGDIYPENSFTRWDAFYRTINYCNTILLFAPNVMNIDPSFTEEMLANYEAEALAIRALMYFYLARTFKEVPLRLEATTTDGSDFYLPKSSHGEILTQIKNDLREAENKAVYTYNNLKTDKARITKYTVNAIQSDVFLWTEQYDSTLLACNKIINSGIFGLVEGDENWFLKLYVNGNSVESIFELPYGITKQNPYYGFLRTSQYYRASGGAMEEYFPFDPDAPADSIDIRSDGCSYKASSNMTIWKPIGINRDEARLSSESFANIILYRYAEILLNKAEALNELGRGEEALAIAKQIRTRASASKIGNYDYTDRLLLGERLLDERGRELAFEGKRWFDVLRYAKRNHYERIELMLPIVTRNAPSDRQITVLNKYRDTLSHYLPIYYRELEINPNLEQNPFYITQSED